MKDLKAWEELFAFFISLQLQLWSVLYKFIFLAFNFHALRETNQRWGCRYVHTHSQKCCQKKGKCILGCFFEILSPPIFWILVASLCVSLFLHTGSTYKWFFIQFSVSIRERKFSEVSRGSNAESYARKFGNTLEQKTVTCVFEEIKLETLENKIHFREK